MLMAGMLIRVCNIRHDPLEFSEQKPVVPAAVRTALPDIDFGQRLIGVAHVENATIGAQDLIGDGVDDEGLAHRQVVDVVLGRAGGVGGGGLGVDVGYSRSQVQGGGEADAHQVGGHGQAGERVGHGVVDDLLDHVQKAGGDLRGDAVDVHVESPGVAVEDHVLDAGDLENLEAQGGFVGAGLGLQFQVDAVAVVFVGFGVAAAHHAVGVGDQQGSVGGVGVVGEVVAGKDAGGGVGQAAGYGAADREVGGRCSGG